MYSGLGFFTPSTHFGAMMMASSLILKFHEKRQKRTFDPRWKYRVSIPAGVNSIIWSFILWQSRLNCVGFFVFVFLFFCLPFRHLLIVCLLDIYPGL